MTNCIVKHCIYAIAYSNIEYYAYMHIMQWGKCGDRFCSSLLSDLCNLGNMQNMKKNMQNMKKHAKHEEEKNMKNMQKFLHVDQVFFFIFHGKKIKCNCRKVNWDYKKTI